MEVQKLLYDYSFQSELLKTDVTVVKFVDKYLLAGIGNNIHIYSITPLRFVYQIKIFQYHRIHGIRLNRTNSTLAIYGNKSIAIALLDFNSENVLSLVSTFQLADWIVDAKFLGRSEVVILAAHNEINIWNKTTKEIIKKIKCPINCLLYSGLILINEDDLNDVIVFSGTCFKKIIIWSPFQNNSEKVLHVLDDHKGAIFSIYYNKRLSRFSSTSDDRTVKVWQVSNYGKSEHRLIQFSVSLILTIYGHVSRVWKSILLDDGKIITVSEDSQLRIWDQFGNPLKQWETHQGASVWSLDVNNRLSLIATGGKDGAINSWPLTNCSINSTVSSSCETTCSGIESNLNVIPRQLIFTNGKKIIVANDNGAIMWSHVNSDLAKWNVVLKDERLSSYCLLEISLERDYVCLASITGLIIVLKELDDEKNTISKIFANVVCTGKIYSIHWLQGNQIITCVANGVLELWKILHDENNSVCELFKICQFILPNCKERWLTSALKYDKYIIVGDRDGSVHLYSSECNNSDGIVNSPLSAFRRIHSRLGVSSICCLKSGRICSTGRDGYIRYWAIRDNKLVCMSADKLMIKWPIKILHDKNYGLLILGFNEVNFELWSIEERRQLLRIRCGGGHRSWDFLLDDQVYFSYIKTKTINNISVPLNHLITPSYLSGFHIKEINCATCINGTILITGSEDNTLRFSHATTDFKTLAILRSHISSIRTVAVAQLDDCYFVVSAGGRAQLKIWKICFDDIGHLEHTELTSHMLRGEDKICKPWRSNTPKSELEPRYMDVNVLVQEQLKKLIITAAYSDGLWRLFTFDTTHNHLLVKYECSYHRHCILKLITVHVKSKYFVITMATNGEVSFWNITDFALSERDINNSQEPVYSIKIHESGINSCDHLVLEHNSLILCTGGDDTALIISVFTIDSFDQVSLKSQDAIRNAHHSQITGIKLIDHLVISTSVDQRIKVWKWSTEDDGTSTILKSTALEYRSTVPDVHGLTTWNLNGDGIMICIYGVGLEMIKYNCQKFY